MGKSSEVWRVAREWNGESCSIIAGGPSLAGKDLRYLEGSRVIAVNCGWRLVPWAEVLFFGDTRWWDHYGIEAVAGFRGRIATCALGIAHPRVVRLNRSLPPGLASQSDTVMIRRTSVTAAINLAVHFGVNQITLHGVDNRVDAEGRTHHHARHPWDLRHGWQAEQSADFASIVKPLEVLGVKVFNESPISNLPFWPRANDETPDFDQRDARARRQPAPARADTAIP